MQQRGKFKAGLSNLGLGLDISIVDYRIRSVLQVHNIHRETLGSVKLSKLRLASICDEAKRSSFDNDKNKMTNIQTIPRNMPINFEPKWLNLKPKLDTYPMSLISSKKHTKKCKFECIMIITDRFYRRGTFLGLHAMAIKWAILIIGNHNQ